MTYLRIILQTWHQKCTSQKKEIDTCCVIINQVEANCRSTFFNDHEEEWTEIWHCTTRISDYRWTWLPTWLDYNIPPPLLFQRENKTLSRSVIKSIYKCFSHKCLSRNDFRWLPINVQKQCHISFKVHNPWIVRVNVSRKLGVVI